MLSISVRAAGYLTAEFDYRKSEEQIVKKKYILFDLDGTLTDSQEGIVNSIEYMLEAYGIRVEDRSQLRPWLGPPLKDSLMKYYGFDRKTALEGVDKYREYFDRKGIFENKVYPGVETMLSQLKERGCELYVATSKPETAAVRIMEHFGLSRYFTYVGGATLDDSRTKKGDVLRYVLGIIGDVDKSQIIMVGDRENDVMGAKENGVEVIGVLYGYGTRQELCEAGADYIAETAEDILKFV